MTEIHGCPFCERPKDRIVAGDAHALGIRDAYAVTAGHTLIIPRRHVGSYFETGAEERNSFLHLLDEAKRQLDRLYRPAGFNIGINDGPAAGETVGHLHIHLIPRYAGDQEDPRGGVRWVIPEKADYWSKR
jgi:diadenosine tetraphosphate (Ap4A) HIT family hydrolase